MSYNEDYLYCISFSKEKINQEYIKACKEGDLEKIKLLLTSSKLEINADVSYKDDSGFIEACKNGHLDVVKYLLISPELNKHSDIHAQNDYGFRWACREENLDIVKYLLESPNLKEHVYIHAYNDEWFKNSCINNSLDIIKYFIFDLKIEKTQTIEKFINKNHYKNIKNMFKLRDLNKTLEQELKENNSTIKKVKL